MSIDTSIWNSVVTTEGTKLRALAWFIAAVTRLHADAIRTQSSRLDMTRRLSMDVSLLTPDSNAGEIAGLAQTYETIRRAMGADTWAPPITIAVPLFEDTSNRHPAEMDPAGIDQAIAAARAAGVPDSHPLMVQAIQVQGQSAESPPFGPEGVALTLRVRRMTAWLRSQVPRLASDPTFGLGAGTSTAPAGAAMGAGAPGVSTSRGGGLGMLLLIVGIGYGLSKRGRR